MKSVSDLRLREKPGHRPRLEGTEQEPSLHGTQLEVESTLTLAQKCVEDILVVMTTRVREGTARAGIKGVGEGC